ncbi:hypothetical protein T484DRAFT_1789987, partial [Baffinella frigidus]
MLALGGKVALLLEQADMWPKKIVNYAAATAEVILSTPSALKDQVPVNVVEGITRSIEWGHAATDIVLKLWLLDEHRSHLLFDTFAPESGMVQLRVWPEPPTNASSQNAKEQPRIYDLESVTSAGTEAAKAVYAVYLAQLELLVALCKDCNLEARTLVVGQRYEGQRCHVSYSAVLQCMGNERLPMDLRCLYTRLMLSAPEYARLSRTKTSFRRDEIEQHPAGLPKPAPAPQQTVSSLSTTGGEKGVDSAAWASLKTLVLRSMSSKADEGGGREQLVLVMLKLAHQLLHQGAWADEDEVERHLIPQLTRLLDSGGSSDATESVNDDPKEAKHVEAIGMLDTICDLRLSARLHMVLSVCIKVMRNKMRTGSMATSNLRHSISSFGRPLTHRGSSLLTQNKHLISSFGRVLTHMGSSLLTQLERNLGKEEHKSKIELALSFLDFPEAGR